MTATTEIRESWPDDLGLIERLYPDAFPEEELLALVRALLEQDPPVLSLVATEGESLAGHVIFTRCGVEGESETAALLGPLAVASRMQRQGVGSALVRAGLRRLEEEGMRHVLVLGDPAYYGRFGFVADSGISPPYALPEAWRDAWQGLTLGEKVTPVAGTLRVPVPWQRPELWS